MPEVWIVMIGNLADGYDFIGPFEDSEAACDWAEEHQDREDDWRVIKLTGKDEK